MFFLTLRNSKRIGKVFCKYLRENFRKIGKIARAIGKEHVQFDKLLKQKRAANEIRTRMITLEG